MTRFQAMGVSVSMGGGRRVTLMEAGEPVVSQWAPTFSEAFRGVVRMEDIRRASMTDEQRQARHDAASRVNSKRTR